MIGIKVVLCINLIMNLCINGSNLINKDIIIYDSVLGSCQD